MKFLRVHPNVPRLTGLLSYGPPHFWKLATDDDGIRIVADSNRNFAIAMGVMGILTILAGELGARFLVQPNVSGIKWFIAPLPGVGIIVLGFALSAAAHRKSVGGPLFSWRSDNDTFTIGHPAISLARDHIISWDLVSGVWINGGDNEPQLFGDQIVELQLLIKSPAGDLEYIPVIGALGRHGLNQVAATISSETRVPLTIVNADSYSKPQ